MNTKLFTFSLLVCSIWIFSGCREKQQKENQTTTIPQAIQKAIEQKYPNATILSFEKEHNGSEVEIQDQGIKKEVQLGSNNEWISTMWSIRAEDVPVNIVYALENSAYNQYDIQEVDVIERPQGLFYTYELKQFNNEVKITFDSTGLRIV